MPMRRMEIAFAFGLIFSVSVQAKMECWKKLEVPSHWQALISLVEDSNNPEITQVLKTAKDALAVEGTQYVERKSEELLILPDAQSFLGKLAGDLKKAKDQIPELDFSVELVFAPLTTSLTNTPGIFSVDRESRKLVVWINHFSLIENNILGQQVRAHEIGVHFKTFLDLVAGRANPHHGSVTYLGREDHPQVTMNAYLSFSFDESLAFRRSVEVLPKVDYLEEDRFQTVKTGSRINYSALNFVRGTFNSEPQFIRYENPGMPTLFFADWNVTTEVDGETAPFRVRLPLLKSRAIDDPRNLSWATEQREQLIKALGEDAEYFESEF